MGMDEEAISRTEAQEHVDGLVAALDEKFDPEYGDILIAGILVNEGGVPQFVLGDLTDPGALTAAIGGLEVLKAALIAQHAQLLARLAHEDKASRIITPGPSRNH